MYMHVHVMYIYMYVMYMYMCPRTCTGGPHVVSEALHYMLPVNP